MDSSNDQRIGKASIWLPFWCVFLFIHFALASCLVWLRLQSPGPETLRILPADLLVACGGLICGARLVLLRLLGRTSSLVAPGAMRIAPLQAILIVGLFAYFYAVLFLAILPVGQ